MRRIAIVLPFLLAACSEPPPPAVTQTPPAQPAPVAPAPPPAEPVPVASVSSYAGYRDTRFGMDEAAFRAAWKEPLAGSADGEACYFLWPTTAAVPSDFAFMFEGGKFVRYSTEKDIETAPGGGKVGMMEEQIAALYPGRIEEQPHKYVDGRYLRIKSDTGDHGVLIFEADDKGTVTSWRVGVEPQIDYVEGCS